MVKFSSGRIQRSRKWGYLWEICTGVGLIRTSHGATELSVTSGLCVFQQQCLQSTQGHAQKFTHPSPQQGLTRSTNLVIGTDSQLPDCTVLVLFANVCLCVCSVRLQTPACVHSRERPGHCWEDGCLLIIWHVIPSSTLAQPPVHMEERKKEFSDQSDLTDSLLYCLGRPVPSIARWHLITHLSHQCLMKCNIIEVSDWYTEEVYHLWILGIFFFSSGLVS